MEQDIKKVLISKEQIEMKIMEMGKILSNDYKDKNPIVICILKGSLPFTADLIRSMDIHLETDFIAISSYGSSTKSSGVVRILTDLSLNIEGRDVIILEDIIDSGLTLNYLKNMLYERNPKSLKICTFLDKPEGRKVQISADYVGFEVPNEFVVGYGLDYAEKYRNLPYIGILKEEVYS